MARKIHIGTAKRLFFLRVLLYYRFTSKFRRFVGVGAKLQKGHNSVIIIGQHFIVKFFKEAEKLNLKEYVNYSRVCNLFPSLCPYFSIPHLLQIQSFSLIISRKLEQSCNDIEKINLALLLYRKFTETGIFRSGAKAADFEHLINGAAIISDIYDTKMANAILKDVNSYLQENKVSVGLRHGDFHPGNIFKDADGQPVLIDLDSIRENSIQSIDPVYYCVEAMKKYIKGEWYNLLHQMNIDPAVEQKLTGLLHKFGINYRYEQILLFVLDRIAFETSIGIVYSQKQLNPLIAYFNKNRYDRKNFA